jgi:hypothetical protein
MIRGFRNHLYFGAAMTVNLPLLTLFTSVQKIPSFPSVEGNDASGYWLEGETDRSRGLLNLSFHLGETYESHLSRTRSCLSGATSYRH